MKRIIVLLFVLITLVFSFSSCTLGNNLKNMMYTMEIKNVYFAYETDDIENREYDFIVVYCERGFSTFNYYIIVEEPPAENMKTLKAEKTDEKHTFYILDNGKVKKVTDHGYKFKDWGD